MFGCERCKNLSRDANELRVTIKALRRQNEDLKKLLDLEKRLRLEEQERISELEHALAATEGVLPEEISSQPGIWTRLFRSATI